MSAPQVTDRVSAWKPLTPGGTAYYGPHPETTGRCQYQPRAEHTNSAWHFDAGWNFHDCGFLDAPEFIGTGSVRARDIGGVTLGLASTLRGEAVA